MIDDRQHFNEEELMTKKEFKSYLSSMGAICLIWGFGLGIIWSDAILKSFNRTWSLVGSASFMIGTIGFLIYMKKTRQFFDS